TARRSGSGRLPGPNDFSARTLTPPNSPHSHSYSLPYTVFVCFFGIINARYLEADMFMDERTRTEYVGIVLRDLHDHCVNASKEFAIVFDMIASLLVDFREAFKLCCEIHTMHDLLLPDSLPEDRYI
ncbi:hypothetical protein AAVH_34033, partial [Aphelenchoides avenae]